MRDCAEYCNCKSTRPGQSRGTTAQNSHLSLISLFMPYSYLLSSSTLSREGFDREMFV
jgi:hypothetical protein